MASCIIARAPNRHGLNRWAKLSYSAPGMLHSSRIHSASRQIVPSDLVYSPSRNEYAPKWMNMPNRSLRHQDVRAEVNGSSTAELVPGPAVSAESALMMSIVADAATGGDQRQWPEQRDEHPVDRK